MNTLRLIGRAIVTCLSIDGGMIVTLLVLWIFITSPRRVISWLIRARRGNVSRS